MDKELVYFTLMLVPMLAGRSMLTILSSSCFAFLGERGYLNSERIDAEALGILTELPPFVSDPKFLVIMLVLAILENRISTSPSLQEIWTLHEAKLKGVIAILVSMVMVSESTLLLFNSAHASSDISSLSSQIVWLSFENVWVAFIGFLTWLVTVLRSAVMLFLIEADHDDSLGLRKFIGRLEASLGVFGPLAFLVIPAAALFIFLSVLGILSLVKMRVRHLEKSHQSPCHECGHDNHNSAFHCANCDSALKNVKDVGFMGLSKHHVQAGEPAVHIQKLLRASRCSYCAGKSSNDGMASHCKACDRPFFNTRDEGLQYIQNIRKRIPLTLLVTSACGFFPVVGFIPGIIFYRIYLLSGLKIYTNLGAGFLIRLLLRIFFIFLILFNFTPFFGFVSIPIMAMANYFMYSKSLKNQLDSMDFSSQNEHKTLASRQPVTE